MQYIAVSWYMYILSVSSSPNNNWPFQMKSGKQTRSNHLQKIPQGPHIDSFHQKSVTFPLHPVHLVRRLSIQLHKKTLHFVIMRRNYCFLECYISCTHSHPVNQNAHTLSNCFKPDKEFTLSLTYFRYSSRSPWVMRAVTRQIGSCMVTHPTRVTT